jgi:hypothetical protein
MYGTGPRMSASGPETDISHVSPDVAAPQCQKAARCPLRVNFGPRDAAATGPLSSRKQP